MSFGKMRSFIKIVSKGRVKDSEGFASTVGDTTLASVRACKEVKRGSEAWKNRAAFSNSDVLFRFRKIPGLDIATDMCILCDGERYNITSVEDVRGRGMYLEVLAVSVKPSG